ncbi:MAG: HIT domain-containing protein [Verrucomicrobia bacterium]|nr:HIT domain-containing protein [Verrucomicrobiota bacterium]
MENLWAPWRLDYIKSEKEAGCFLCRALASTQDRETLLLKRGQHCGLMINRYPYNNGHLMVFPFRHTQDLLGLSPEEDRESAALVRMGVKILRKHLGPEGFNIGINLGKVAGAGLEEHLHTHIVPRWTGDTNFMPALAGIKVVPQSLHALYDQLAPDFSDSPM